MDKSGYPLKSGSTQIKAKYSWEGIVCKRSDCYRSIEDSLNEKVYRIPFKEVYSFKEHVRSYVGKGALKTACLQLERIPISLEVNKT